MILFRLNKDVYFFIHYSIAELFIIFHFFPVNCLLNFCTYINILGTIVISAATKIVMFNLFMSKMSNKRYTY